MFSNIAKGLEILVSPSENSLRSLDIQDPNDPNKVIPFGKLGDFATKIDSSAQRSYVEDGFISNVRPSVLESLQQEPDMTVLIKKRMFSSLAQNFRFDLMNPDDKLFIKASKKLFQNKCSVISTYEKLSKIDRIVGYTGVIDEYILPQIFAGFDALDAAGINIIDDKTRAIFNTIKKVNAFSTPSKTTTWLTDSSATYSGDLGEGTGVIELTLIANISTRLATKFASGGGSMTIEDPYSLMIITDDDIDKAITDATNLLSNSSFFKFTESSLEKVIYSEKQDLNTQRADMLHRLVL